MTSERSDQRTGAKSGSSYSSSSRLGRPPSALSVRRSGGGSGSHSRGQSRSSDEPSYHSQPSSPMTYFPNPSTFTQEPSHTTTYQQSSVQTSPSLSSARFAGSISQSSLLSEPEELDVSSNTPRLPATNPTASDPTSAHQQQFYMPTPSALHLPPPSEQPAVPASATSPRITPSRRSASAAATGRSRQSTINTINTISNYGATEPITPGLLASTSSAGTATDKGRSSDNSLPSGLPGGLNIDPRRIASTSGAIMVGGGPSSRHADGPAPPPPSSYSGITRTQPQTTASTPRFRTGSVDEDSTRTTGSAIRSSSRTRGPVPSSSRSHRRGGSTVSNHFVPQTPSLLLPTPHSPSGSTMLNRFKKTASSIGFGRAGEYDADSDYGTFDDGEDDGRRANGTRVWYASYVTIDWLHDAIKESTRVRRLRTRARRSLRGAILNAWDRFQGWLLATLIGVLTAFVAFLIIRSEMVFFDLKDGYCSSKWGSPRRFCCAPKGHPDSGEEACGDWVTWGQFFDNTETDADASFFSEPEFIMYFWVAIALACTASALTYYLTSSATHVTSKDSAFLGPALDNSSPLVSPTKLPDERMPLLYRQGSEEERAPEPARPVIYFAGGSGIPEIKTILSGFVIHGYLGLSTLLVKSIGLAMSVGSGLSLGKEGPFVHIASCIANICSRFFSKYETNEGKRREILSAACAAGVAVSFGAPIGGVLFSLEEVSYYFPPKVMWRSFWCAACAALVLKALNPYGNGSIVLFAVTYTSEYHYWEFGIFIILGIFGGLYGALFSRLNIIWSRDVRKGTWLGRHPIFEVALVTALTCVVSFMNPYTRLGGNELVGKMFAECSVDTTSSLCIGPNNPASKIIWTVFIALLIKASLTIITFGLALPAGIFIPSLVIGACFGRIMGVVMELVQQNYPALSMFEGCTKCVIPGVYAMVGAAATLAGVTRTTVSLAVIMFELTGTLNYTVPVMLAVLIAKTVADALEKRGIYELVIELKKLPYLSDKEEVLFGGRLVSEVMDREAPTLRADKPHTVRELTGRLLELVRLGYEDAGFPVLTKEAAVDREGRTYPVLRVVGFLGINELEHALSALADEPDAVVNLTPDEMMRSSRLSIFSFSESVDGRHNPYDLSQYIDRAPITVQMHSPLELVQELFIKLGSRQILVTDSRGTYRGALYKKQWIAYLDDLEHEHS